MRLGIIRDPMDPKTDTSSEDYKKFRVVTDQAIRRLELLGAELVHPFSIPELKDRGGKAYEADVFETEEATGRYLAQHPDAPGKSLSDIVNSGRVVRSGTNLEGEPRQINKRHRVLGVAATERGDTAACSFTDGGSPG